MGVAPQLKELEGLSDKQIRDLYDQQAQSTMVGTQFYLEELNRRALDRQTEVMLRYTRWITIMTIIILVATIISTAATIYSAFR